MNYKTISIKFQLIFFLICYAIYLSILDRNITFLLGVSIAVISAVLFDSFAVYLKEKKFLITESSVISGLIIGYVLSRDKKQDNNTNQTVSYFIPDAKKGDTISVEAYCNISGKLEKKIKI